MQSARGFEYGVVHFISPRSGCCNEILSAELSMSMEKLQSLLDLGAIYYQHQRLKDNFSLSEAISKGDYFRLHTKPRRFLANDGNWAERVIFENENFVVVNKPAALPVHASVDNIRENVLAYLAQHLKTELFITHRLDVPTKGLLVFAKSRKFQTEFNKQLIAREVKKIYRAVVQAPGPELGLMTHYMEPSPRAPKKLAMEPLENWQECRLQILEKRELDANWYELKIELLTGRTHQIRAQLAHQGFPIQGDVSYGAERIFLQEEINLTACELAFPDSISGKVYHFKT